MFSWSSSADERLIIGGRAFGWFALSLNARRNGLLGEVLRRDGRVPLRFTENRGLGTGSVVLPASALYARESPEGEAGTVLFGGEVFDERV